MTCRSLSVALVTVSALTLSLHAAVIRATGTIQPIRSVAVRVPNIEGQGGNLTLTRLVENGAIVHKGDLIAEFDRTNALKLLREANAKYDDLSHQVEQKRAEHRNNAEKRASDLQGAESDLHKAELEITKGPILSDIDREKNKVKLADAKEHVASLHKSNSLHDQAEAAELRVLELQRDRQKYAVERETRNADRLAIHAPIDGMIAMQNVFRNNSLGHAQEGDQLWPGSPILRLFDPSSMYVDVSAGEPDGAALKPGTKATVHLDAYPQLAIPAHLDSASPIASMSGPEGGTKIFSARFVLDASDPHLLPDLSAAVDIPLQKQ